MERMSSSWMWQWSIGAFLGVLHSTMVAFTYKRVPEPYMDEIFHIDQARRYCSFDYSWNPKITTPPALYILSFFGFCARERYTNSLLIPFFFVGAIRVRQLFTQKNLLEVGLVVLFLPVLFHSSLLYYTDLLSVTVILWAFSCTSPGYASILFAVAVLTRQTNIMWAAMYGAAKLIEHVDLNKNLNFFYSYCVAIIARLWTLILLAICFVIFFIWNDFRVVLGDHSAHQPVPHFMQLYYFMVFACFSAAPYLLLSGVVQQGVRNFFRIPLLSVVFCAFLMCCIRLFTFEHPYLLADNRHFTFYVWRKWFRRHWLCKFLLAPVYVLAVYIFQETVKHIHRYTVLLSALVTAIVLVPLPLLEPRYYILPYILWRLSAVGTDRRTVWLEIAYSCLINAVALYLFYEKPFEWPHEPGVLQRFMW